MTDRSLLARILDDVAAAPGPVRLDDLAGRLAVEPSALAAMLEFWERKGRLAPGALAAGTACPAPRGVCGPACPPVGECPFLVRLPPSYAIKGPPESEARR